MKIKNAIKAMITLVMGIIAVWIAHNLIVLNIMNLMTDSLEKTMLTYFVVIIYLLIIFILPITTAIKEE